MKEWITEDGEIPRLYPGMLIHTAEDRWLQITSVDYTHGCACWHYLAVGPDSRLVITDSATDRCIPGRLNCSGVNEVYKLLDRHQRIEDGVKPLALPHHVLRQIIRGDRGIFRVAVWRNPNLPIKMTVSEIENKLGHKVEIISEKEN